MCYIIIIMDIVAQIIIMLVIDYILVFVLVNHNYMIIMDNIMLDKLITQAIVVMNNINFIIPKLVIKFIIINMLAEGILEFILNFIPF